LIPFHDCKIVTLIRHAQGYHNAAGERDRDSYKDEKYRDAHLTERGWAQGRRAREHSSSVYSSGQLPRPELVVVSPLMRTLETAGAIFGFEEEEGLGDESARLLMKPRPAVKGRVGPAPSNGIFADLPFIAHEDCREETGAHPCDGRRPKSESAAAFPGVDFSLIEHEHDDLYSRQREGEREPKESVMARARKFAQWLLSRPERHIAVVSHAGFLHFFARAVGAPNLSVQGASHGESLTSSLTRWFDNAESRVLVLANASGGNNSASKNDPLHFAGGGFEEFEEEEEVGV